MARARPARVGASTRHAGAADSSVRVRLNVDAVDEERVLFLSVRDAGPGRAVHAVEARAHVGEAAGEQARNGPREPPALVAQAQAGARVDVAAADDLRADRRALQDPMS